MVSSMTNPETRHIERPKGKKRRLPEIKPVSIPTRELLEAAQLRAEAEERERLERLGTAVS